MKFHWKIVLIIILLNSEKMCFASEAPTKPPWLVKFMDKKWQEFRGLSCGTNMFYFKGDQYITVQGKGVDPIFYTITKVDDKSRSFVIKALRFVEDVPYLSQMLPQYSDRILSTRVYTFRLLSDDRVEIIRRDQMMDFSAMIAGGPLSYKPAVISTQVVFDCE